VFSDGYYEMKDVNAYWCLGILTIEIQKAAIASSLSKLCYIAAMSPTFWISIYFQRRSYRYHVTYTPLNERREQFVVKAKNKALTFHSNRPFLKSQVGLKKWSPTYELVQGELNNTYFKELIVQEFIKFVSKSN
jgi:hypothetical protein